jgi:two-component system cell cycle sensor histidine kinase/response regulator CckA
MKFFQFDRSKDKKAQQEIAQLNDRIAALETELSNQKKQAEKTVQNQETRYQQVINQMVPGIAVYEAIDNGNDFIFKYINPAGAQIGKKTHEEHIGQSILTVYPKAKENGLFGLLQQVWTTGISGRLPITAYQDTQILLWVENHVFKLQTGEVVSVFEDLTEKKRTEELFHTNEERLAMALDGANDGLWDWNIETNEVYYSPRWKSMLGYKDHEIKHEFTEWERLIHPDDLSKSWDTLNQAIESQGNRFDIEFRMRHKDGHWIDILSRALIYRRKEDNQPYRVVGTHVDITERKKIEEALRKSEARYRSLYSTMNEGVALHEVIYDDSGKAIDYRIIDVNQAYSEITKISAEKAIGSTGSELYEIEDPPFLDQYVEVAKKGVPISFDINWEPMDKYFNIAVFSPEPGKFATVFTDITDQHKATQQLEENEKRLRSIISAMPALLDAFDENGNIIFWNTECERVTGYTADEVMGIPNILETFYPDPQYRQLVIDSVQKQMGDFTNLEFEITCKDGSKKVISWSNISKKYPISGWTTWAIGIDITDRKHAEEKLRQNEERFRNILDSVSVGIYAVELKTKIITYVNPAAIQLIGLSKENIIGKKCTEIVCDSEKECCPAIHNKLSTYSSEQTIRNVNGEQIPVLKRVAPVILNEQECLLTSFIDLTPLKKVEEEKAQLEEQLFQSQKMQSIGTLAGGIAHDFNNILMAILGYSQSVMEEISVDNPLYKDIEEIYKAGNRAASLTNQLLAFSRKQIIQPKLVNLNEKIFDLQKMLRRLMGENIEIGILSDPDIGNIKTDPGQIDQIVMNIAVNARDAMSEGGTFIIKTARIYLDDDYCKKQPEVEPGNYIMLSLSDTGSGIAKEIQNQIFDPFFTTKDQGKGTGLGLSTVYGIVKQNNGHITLSSEIEKGSTFEVYFPEVEISHQQQEDRASYRELYQGNESILLVEDEEIVRKYLARALIQKGYSVHTAGYYDEVLKRFYDPNIQVDLLITDVILPHASGKDIAEALLKIQPSLKVLFMSGYTDNAIGYQNVLDEGIQFLQKPFTPEVFFKKIREILDTDN